MDSLFPIECGAQFSPCRTWRYTLWRTWDQAKGHVMFIGLNPSTADETEDDPTIRRCIGFARTWGYGGIYMLNLFAFRATNPKDMQAANDPVGPVNNIMLKDYAESSCRVIAAWGTHGTFQHRDEQVQAMLASDKWGLECLGHTKGGHPKHPLYLRKDTRPVVWLLGKT